MVSPPLAISRCASVAPAVVPALRPTVYAVFFVQRTVTVVVWSTLPPSGSTVPKPRSAALTVHWVATLAVTWKVAVAVAATAACIDATARLAPSSGRRTRGTIRENSMSLSCVRSKAQEVDFDRGVPPFEPSPPAGPRVFPEVAGVSSVAPKTVARKAPESLVSSFRRDFSPTGRARFGVGTTTSTAARRRSTRDTRGHGDDDRAPTGAAAVRGDARRPPRPRRVPHRSRRDDDRAHRGRPRARGPRCRRRARPRSARACAARRPQGRARVRVHPLLHGAPPGDARPARLSARVAPRRWFPAVRHRVDEGRVEADRDHALCASTLEDTEGRHRTLLPRVRRVDRVVSSRGSRRQGGRMTRIVGISGSLRRGSYNSALLRAAAASMPGGAALVVGSTAGIPLYDGDADAANRVPPPVAALKDAIPTGDGLLLA